METGQVKDVQEVIGMTDYESSLDGIFPKVTGMMEIKEFRISANVDGDIIFLYKSNSTIDGWLPKPFEKTEDFVELAKVFKHPDPYQGAPVHCNRYPGSSAREETTLVLRNPLCWRCDKDMGVEVYRYKNRIP